MMTLAGLVNLALGAALLAQMLLTFHAYFRPGVAHLLGAGVFLGCLGGPRPGSWLYALLPHFQVYFTSVLSADVLAANFLYFCVWSGYLGFFRSLVEPSPTA